MKITGGKLITISAKTDSILEKSLPIGEIIELKVAIDSLTGIKESGRFYLDLTYHIMKQTKDGRVIMMFAAEYNFTIERDYAIIEEDLEDLYKHVYTGLTLSLNTANGNRTNFQSGTYGRDIVKPTAEKIKNALIQCSFYFE